MVAFDSFSFMDDISSFRHLERQLRALGFRQGVPAAECEQDRALVERECCPVCGGPRTFVPLVRGPVYRAFDVCHRCDTAHEF
jgi:hypothetical protein